MKTLPWKRRGGSKVGGKGSIILVKGEKYKSISNGNLVEITGGKCEWFRVFFETSEGPITACFAITLNWGEEPFKNLPSSQYPNPYPPINP